MTEQSSESHAEPHALNTNALNVTKSFPFEQTTASHADQKHTCSMRHTIFSQIGYLKIHISKQPGLGFARDLSLPSYLLLASTFKLCAVNLVLSNPCFEILFIK